jgi:predicted metal-binding protein
MNTISKKAIKRAKQLGIATAVEFDASLLVPQQSIRAYCVENKCGKYKKHYMCPPHSGTVTENAPMLRHYRNGILFQYEKPLDVAHDVAGLTQSKLEFHRKILELEKLIKDSVASPVLGIIGGSCELCSICKATTGEPCAHPEDARMSLESMAIDVMALLKHLGLESEFRPDRIKWTGAVLF